MKSITTSSEREKKRFFASHRHVVRTTEDDKGEKHHTGQFKYIYNLRRLFSISTKLYLSTYLSSPYVKKEKKNLINITLYMSLVERREAIFPYTKAVKYSFKNSGSSVGLLRNGGEMKQQSLMTDLKFVVSTPKY